MELHLGACTPRHACSRVWEVGLSTSPCLSGIIRKILWNFTTNCSILTFFACEALLINASLLFIPKINENHRQITTHQFYNQHACLGVGTTNEHIAKRCSQQRRKNCTEVYWKGCSRNFWSLSSHCAFESLSRLLLESKCCRGLL